jgi:hypothetical protein
METSTPLDTCERCGRSIDSHDLYRARQCYQVIYQQNELARIRAEHERERRGLLQSLANPRTITHPLAE